jgi:hypothetical protein
MAVVVNTYRVVAHKGGPLFVLYVQAADGNFETIKSVILANNSIPGTAPLQIQQTAQHGPVALIA